jgi:hypothetical protein
VTGEFCLQQYTVASSDGEFIANVTREERNRLIGCTEQGTAPRYGAPDRLFPDGVPEYNQCLIRQAKSSRLLYFAIVDQSIIRAELRRHISQRVPAAEDSYTWSKTVFADPLGKSGWYFELNERRSFGYPTTVASANEHYERTFGAKPSIDEHKALIIPFPIPPVIEAPEVPSNPLPPAAA